MQFTEQDVEYRTPFWAFPHASVDASTTGLMVSSLYDTVVTQSIERLAAAAVPVQSASPTPAPQSCSKDSSSNPIFVVLIVVVVVETILLLAFLLNKGARKEIVACGGSNDAEKAAALKNPLLFPEED